MAPTPPPTPTLQVKKEVPGARSQPDKWAPGDKARSQGKGGPGLRARSQEKGAPGGQARSQEKGALGVQARSQEKGAPGVRGRSQEKGAPGPGGQFRSQGKGSPGSLNNKARSQERRLGNNDKIRVKEEPRDSLLEGVKEAAKKNARTKSQIKIMNIKKEFVDKAQSSRQGKSQISKYRQTSRMTKMPVKKEFGAASRRSQGIGFNETQRAELSRTFNLTAYPGQGDIRRLEAELGLSGKQLKTWFVNKRTALGIKKTKLGSLVTDMFKPEQLKELNGKFSANSYPSKEERTALARSTGLTDGQIQTWFTSQRTVEGVRKAKKIQLVDLEKKQQKSRMLKAQATSLEQVYQARGLPDAGQLKEVAKDMGLRPQQVRTWFINRKIRASRTTGR